MSNVDHMRGVVIVNEVMDPMEGDTVFGQRLDNGDLIKITPKELDALNEGKILAVDVEGEYVVYLQIEGDS
jgi:hypothetical protein